MRANSAPDAPRGHESQEMATDGRQPCSIADIDGQCCHPRQEHDVRVWYPANPGLGEQLACHWHAVTLGRRDLGVAFAPLREGSAIRAYRAVQYERAADAQRTRDSMANRGNRYGG